MDAYGFKEPENKTNCDCGKGDQVYEEFTPKGSAATNRFVSLDAGDDHNNGARIRAANARSRAASPGCSPQGALLCGAPRRILIRCRAHRQHGSHHDCAALVEFLRLWRNQLRFQHGGHESLYN